MCVIKYNILIIHIYLPNCEIRCHKKLSQSSKWKWKVRYLSHIFFFFRRKHLYGLLVKRMLHNIHYLDPRLFGLILSREMSHGGKGFLSLDSFFFKTMDQVFFFFSLSRPLFLRTLLHHHRYCQIYHTPS